jgi:hypothetical protein
MSTLKSIYLDGASGLSAKLQDAFQRGYNFIMPTLTGTLENAVTIATSSPHVTIANTGSNSQIQAGFTVSWKESGVDKSGTVASPVVSGSTFDLTVAPASAVSDKSMSFSGPRPASYTQLVGDIQAAAAAGKSDFSVSIETSDNPSYLRLNGNYQNAYFAGILQAMGEEGIFSTYEVKLTLDASDTLSTKVKFSFTL